MYIWLFSFWSYEQRKLLVVRWYTIGSWTYSSYEPQQCVVSNGKGIRIVYSCKWKGLSWKFEPNQTKQITVGGSHVPAAHKTTFHFGCVWYFNWKPRTNCRESKTGKLVVCKKQFSKEIFNTLGGVCCKLPGKFASCSTGTSLNKEITLLMPSACACETRVSSAERKVSCVTVNILCNGNTYVHFESK